MSKLVGEITQHRGYETWDDRVIKVRDLHASFIQESRPRLFTHRVRTRLIEYHNEQTGNGNNVVTVNTVNRKAKNSGLRLKALIM